MIFPLTKYTPEKPYTHDPPIGVTLVPSQGWLSPHSTQQQEITATAQIL